MAVDADRFFPGDAAEASRRFGVAGKRVITTVSRVQDYKGHDTVLRAIAALPDDARRAVAYLVAGKGPHLDALQSLAEDLGLTDQVRWLGFVAEDELPALYRATDLFALCTRDQPTRPDVEGFGLVFLEAQACGVPVVGTRTGGIPDAIREGEGGWLIEQDDVPALAAIVSRLVAEPQVFQKAGADARARVERECTWPHYFERFTRALHQAGIALECQ